MNKFIGLFVFLASVAVFHAQQDSVKIRAKLDSNLTDLHVEQHFVYLNTTGNAVTSLQLLNWAAAYKTKETDLVKRKLQDRKTDLHFAKTEETGRLEKLEVRNGNILLPTSGLNEEIITLQFAKPLQPGEDIRLNLKYDLRLPDARFTGYGRGDTFAALKYFFLVPEKFGQNQARNSHYIDIEENQLPGKYWKIHIDIPAGYYAQSNLNETEGGSFEGVLNEDPEILISQSRNDRILTTVKNIPVEIQFGYKLSLAERFNLEYYLPLHLAFIQEKTGFLPRKLFISTKFKNKEGFVGIDDIHFWKFHFKVLPEAQRLDLTYFSIISQKVMEQAFNYNKNADHWWPNGLKTYLEIQYIDQFYPETKLLGLLPEQVKLLGLKPLKIFHASKLKLSERYGLAYQYITTQNLDQSITTPYEKLSNFNSEVVSHFEMGSLFAFVADKMGNEQFQSFLKAYLNKNRNKPADTKQFLDELTVASGYSAEFLEKFIQEKNRVDFKLKRYTKAGDDFQLKIVKNTPLKIPFKVDTETKEGSIQSHWFDTTDKTSAVTYTIPTDKADKIVINDEYIFPERNFRNNYLYTKGLFANMKRVKLKFFTDIPNPEYNEIYLSPRLNFNVYDKVLVGMNFRNSSLFSRRFNYSFTPYYSTGTGSLTGSAGIGYTFQPADSFFRSLSFGASASYFHYDYGLAYRKVSLGASMNFAKNPRSDISRGIGVSYDFFDKDLDPRVPLSTEYQKYNLWNVGYSYSDRQVIHEKSIGANLQLMEDFQKISAEVFYRWQFAKDQKISFRFFGGVFLSNDTKNNLFDYGISRVSNYAFSYGLLGQSATSGLLSQQYVLAEGGFKSYVGDTANQWITAVNVDTHIWWWFNVYADAGIYKNKFQNPQFIWDSGVKLRVIPDFLEIYFPIQSSLGFEPGFKDYGNRIRFTLTLNFSAITSHLRRGYF